jgi:hypothetical protein
MFHGGGKLSGAKTVLTCYEYLFTSIYEGNKFGKAFCHKTTEKPVSAVPASSSESPSVPSGQRSLHQQLRVPVGAVPASSFESPSAPSPSAPSPPAAPSPCQLGPRRRLPVSAVRVSSVPVRSSSTVPSASPSPTHVYRCRPIRKKEWQSVRCATMES